MKLKVFVFAVLALLLFGPIIFAQETGTTLAPPPAPAKAPWAHQTQEVVGAVDIANSQANGHTAINVDVSWAYYTSDKSEVGAVVSVLKGRVDANGQPVDGYGAGPWYRYNFPKLKYGNMYIGGQGQALTGDLLNAATFQAATVFGYRFYIGKSSAVGFEIYKTQAIASNDPAGGQPLNSIGFRIPISLGVGTGTTVQ